MYARYNAFFNGDSCRPTTSTGYTDSTRFSCASIPQPPPINPKEKQCEVKCKIPEPVCRYTCEEEKIKPTIPPNKTQIVFENFDPTISPKAPRDNSKLLPVMNPEFNLREICKQIILLEDHLSHPEKRCTDCCIKHFLTIEALAEEAITLDKQNNYSHLISLPPKVRNLQKKWYENPSVNCLFISQQLREIRKQYMISSFSIIFTENNSCNDCSGGVCKIKK